MAEWPVEISKTFYKEDGAPTPSGEPISVTPTRKDGEIHSYIVLCPKCGLLGDCPVATPTNPANSGERVWAATTEDGRLTMNPSILCACGGHFWLHDGVLRDV